MASLHMPVTDESGKPSMFRPLGTYGIVLLVALLHVAAVWWLIASAPAPVLVSAAGGPEPAGVRVSLVSEARSKPVAVPVIKPETPPVIKPVPAPVKTTRPPVLAAARSESTRSVAPSQPDVQRAAAVPTTPTSIATPTPPEPAAAAVTGNPDSADLALPKPIGASQLQQLGCAIPQPMYPAPARRLGRQGTVSVAVTIDRTGRFSSVSVLRSSGFTDLDEAAIDAVARGHCEPYVENGVARIVTAAQPISFNLGN